MQLNIEWNGKSYRVQTENPIDLSIPLRNGNSNPNAFQIPHPVFEPIKVGDFVGSVAAGSSANCENLFINAHGNGTHTECIGHITKERITINQSLKEFFFVAQLLSLPKKPLFQNQYPLPAYEVGWYSSILLFALEWRQSGLRVAFRIATIHPRFRGCLGLYTITIVR